jgi:hypothetical protein
MVLVTNRRSLLSEVVSLDAWHSPMKVGPGKSEVCVEITFKEGRLGGDDDDFPFTFKMALKRATLAVKLEAPLTIDRRSIARNIPDTLIEQSKVRTLRSKIQSMLSANTQIGTGGLNARLEAGSMGEIAGASEDEIRLIQKVPPILVASEPFGSHEYRWTLEPAIAATLIGQPWDPVAQPRLAARHNFDQLPKLAPEIEVTLSCKLSDTLIEDIQPKDRNMRDLLRGRYSGDARTAAAQQHLKQILRMANLEPGTMDNRFASLIIASVISASEPD